MPCVVPQSNHGTGPCVLVAELAQARRPQKEASSSPWREAEPARGQDPQEMSAREEQDVALDGTHPVYHAVGPHGYRVGRFTVGASIPKKVPIRPLAMDVGAGPSFVAAVVPFDEIGITLGTRAEASELAGPGRALQRAGEDLRERRTLEPLGQPASVLLTTLGQRQIRQSRMLAGEAPRRLTVPREVCRRNRLAHTAAGKAMLRQVGWVVFSVFIGPRTPLLLDLSSRRVAHVLPSYHPCERSVKAAAESEEEREGARTCPIMTCGRSSE